MRGFIGLSLLTLSIAGCATVYNPATKKNELILIDTRQEVALGGQMQEEVKQKMKVSSDPQMQLRLDFIGGQLARISDRQDLKYYFWIIADKELNAFALPGGCIYVNSGLMDAATDDELACVVAHEIGHIAARHSVKRLQAAMGYQIIFAIAAGIGTKQQVAQAVDIAFSLTSLGYSRQDELLADSLAIKYAKRAGFNPAGMASFLKKLKKEAQEKGADADIPFLSSHPPIDKRISEAEKQESLPE